MRTNSIPFNFYSHVACLFPGSILLAYILYTLDRYFYPELSDYLVQLNTFSSILLISILIIGSFISGHISYSISKLTFDHLPFEYFKNKDKFLSYSEEKQKQIIEAIGYIYGSETKGELEELHNEYKENKISGEKFGLKNYCYAMVERKEAKHDMFVGLADFLRSIAFLFALLIIFLFLEFVSTQFQNFNFDLVNLIKSIILVAVAICFLLSLYNRSKRMRQAADSLIYSQFLFDSKMLNKRKGDD
ncbi:hypothetical protein GCM10022378_09460 [Salinicoccus jeotgali]|uniref:SMODS and SLOG-associating 2TM effector domain-containing protein n=1 Tax=Salinicoccus jeotgali TaxID=381634 RepID=A0ABP7EMT2_9STAP